MKPFTPISHGTTAVDLADVVQNIPVANGTWSPSDRQIWIDNRGGTDVLIEFYDDPVDTNSFRIPPNASQPVTIPAAATSVRLKRPVGSASAKVYVTPGGGN